MNTVVNVNDHGMREVCSVNINIHHKRILLACKRKGDRRIRKLRKRHFIG